MSTSRLNRVLVAVEAGDVALPWDSRQTLLERLRREGAEDIVSRFEAVGTTSPVKLTLEQKERLLATLKLWLLETRESPPEGVYSLRNALQGDVRSD